MNINKYTFSNIFLLLIFFSLINSLIAQEFEIHATKDKILYRVPKVNSDITVDAYLDEPFWEQAVLVDANIEVRPGENIPAPVTLKENL